MSSSLSSNVLTESSPNISSGSGSINPPSELESEAKIENDMERSSETSGGIIEEKYGIQISIELSDIVDMEVLRNSKGI